MAQPTVENIMDLVRDLVSDVEVAGGEVLTNDKLNTFFGIAFREMYDALALFGVPRSIITITATIPSNTFQIAPANLSNPVTDLESIVKIEDRPQGSGSLYVPVYPVQEPPQPNAALTALTMYRFENGLIYFAGASTARDIRLRYMQAAPTAPVAGTNTVVAVDNCHNFLAFRTAGLAAKSKGLEALAAQWNGEALGPNLKADGSGGFLAGLGSISHKSLRRLQAQRPAAVRQ